MSRRLWQLENDLLQALDNYVGGKVRAEWELVATHLALAIHDASLSLSAAAEVDKALRATRSQPTGDVSGQLSLFEER